MEKSYKNSFLISELSKIEQDFNFAKYHVIPIPLEKTVSFGKGTSKGPNAILKASNELERSYGKYEPCLKGIHTHAPINCRGNMVKTLKEIQNVVNKICKNKKIPVAIGGEHTLTYGMVTGIKRGLDIVAVSVVDEVLERALTKPLTPIEWNEGDELDTESLTSKNVEGEEIGGLVKH